MKLVDGLHLNRGSIRENRHSRNEGVPLFVGHHHLGDTIHWVGRYRDYPIEQQPKVLKQPIWTSRCQFFGHYPDGYWLHQETHAGTCTSGVPSKKPGLPQTVQWKFLSDGAVLIDRKDAKIRELWKVDRVTRPTHIDKINLIDGDIIMQLLDVERKHILWVRLLRRIGDASDG